SILRPEPSRRPDNCLRKRPKGRRPARTCRIPASIKMNATVTAVPIPLTANAICPPARRWVTTNKKCTRGTSPSVQRKAPKRMRQRKERSTFMSEPSSCVFHPVTQPAHRLNERRAELSPQAADEHLNGIGIAVKVLGIDMLGELALGNHAFSMVHKVRKHAKFMAGQFDLHAFQGHFAGSWIEHKRTAAQLRADLPA